MRHDDLNQSDPLPPSYEMVKAPEEPEKATAASEPAAPRQEAAVKGILPPERPPVQAAPAPAAPAPAPVAVVAPVAAEPPTIISKIFGWFRRPQAEAVATATAVTAVAATAAATAAPERNAKKVRVIVRATDHAGIVTVAVAIAIAASAVRKGERNERSGRGERGDRPRNERGERNQQQRQAPKRNDEAAPVTEQSALAEVPSQEQTRSPESRPGHEWRGMARVADAAAAADVAGATGRKAQDGVAQTMPADGTPSEGATSQRAARNEQGDEARAEGQARGERRLSLPAYAVCATSAH